jgi:hypothetical protein
MPYLYRPVLKVHGDVVEIGREPPQMSDDLLSGCAGSQPPRSLGLFTIVRCRLHILRTADDCASVPLPKSRICS